METTKYTAEQIVQLRDCINKKLVDTQQRIADYDEQLADLEVKTSDEIDLAGHIAEKKLLLQYKANAEKIKIGLENNLQRIDSGTIGICEVTKQRIPFPRMMCVPHATKSVDGKGMDNARKKFPVVNVINSFEERGEELEEVEAEVEPETGTRIKKRR